MYKTLFIFYNLKTNEVWSVVCSFRLNLYNPQFADENAGLTLNFTKTKYLSIGEEKCELDVGERIKINGCENYKYLVARIDSEGNDKLEIKLNSISCRL